MEFYFNKLRIKITGSFVRIYDDEDYVLLLTGEVMGQNILWSSKLHPKTSPDVIEYCEKIIKNKAFL